MTTILSLFRPRHNPPEDRQPPVVRGGALHRPVPFVVDEVIVRSANEERRLFWGPSGYELEPWGDRP